VNQNTRTDSISPIDCQPDVRPTMGNEWITISQGGVIIKREEDASIQFEILQLANTNPRREESTTIPKPILGYHYSMLVTEIKQEGDPV